MSRDEETIDKKRLLRYESEAQPITLIRIASKSRLKRTILGAFRSLFL